MCLNLRKYIHKESTPMGLGYQGSAAQAGLKTTKKLLNGTWEHATSVRSWGIAGAFTALVSTVDTSANQYIFNHNSSYGYRAMNGSFVDPYADIYGALGRMGHFGVSGVVWTGGKLIDGAAYVIDQVDGPN